STSSRSSRPGETSGSSACAIRSPTSGGPCCSSTPRTSHSSERPSSLLWQSSTSGSSGWGATSSPSAATQCTHLARQRGEKELANATYSMWAESTAKSSRRFCVYTTETSLSLC